jgi:hypothetical protein
MNTQIRKSIDWHLVRFDHQQMMCLETMSGSYDANAARYAAKTYFARRDSYNAAYPSRWKFDANRQPSDMLPTSHPEVRAAFLEMKSNPETWPQFVARLTGVTPVETPKLEPRPYEAPAPASIPSPSGPVFEAFKRRIAPDQLKESA